MFFTKKRNRFKSIERLAEIIAEADGMTDANAGVNNRAYASIQKTNALPDLIDTFKKAGIHKIKLLGSGDNAIIIEDPNGLAFRLRGSKSDHPSTMDTPDIDQVIRPFYRAEIAGIRVLGVPKLRSLKKELSQGRISQEEADQYVLALRISVLRQEPKSIFWDWKHFTGIKYDQIGLLEDNTPILIDMGCVLEVQKLLEYLEGDRNYQKFSDEIQFLDSKIVPTISGWDGSWHTKEKQRKTDVLAEQEGARFKELIR